MNDFFITAPEPLNESQTFFNKEAFSSLYSLEERHFWFRSRNKLILWAINTYFPRANHFFEIGCGTGYVIHGIQKRFPTLPLYASDIFQESLEFARTRLGESAKLFQMDARRIPFQTQFDLIGAFDVLEHIKEDEIVLQEIHRILKPEGGLLLTVPQHPRLWSAADTQACHKRRYRSTELQQKLTAHGFKIVFTTSFVSLLLPLMYLSRFKHRKTEPNYRELQPGKMVNTILESIQSIERFLIQKGVSFPIGGSRLIVAQK